MNRSKAPVCPYSGHDSKLVDGSWIYPRRPDLHAKQFYHCGPCNAYVGCHPGTTVPLGRLADAKLRSAKMAAHSNFDRLWKSKKMRRHVAYARLADKMGIPRELAHIGMFDVAQCLRVVELVRAGALDHDTRGGRA